MKKVEIARKVFLELKSESKEISRAKVAELANVSRSLFSPDTNGNYKSEEWERLSLEIQAISECKATEKKSKIQKLREKVLESERKYRAQVQQNLDLIAVEVKAKADIETYKTAYERCVQDLDELNQRVLLNHVPFLSQESSGTVIPISQKIVISVDAKILEITGGVYNWDSVSLRKAHTFTRQKLQQVLQHPFQKKLFITIGRPACGKSSWIESHKPSSDKIAIYYDATNATRADRWELINIANISQKTEISFVYFAINVDTCIQNNRKRASKPITDEYIKNFSLETPDIEEGFDELIMVRK